MRFASRLQACAWILLFSAAAGAERGVAEEFLRPLEPSETLAIPNNPAQPLPLSTYRSLEPEAQLLDQDRYRRNLVEGAVRRDMILSPECPLILFFGSTYGAEAQKEQMQKVPEQCQSQYREWRRTHVQTLEEPLRSPAAVEEIEYASDYDDAKEITEIDADGLAWQIERIPANKKEEPVTYVVVEERGARWEMKSGTETRTVEVPARTQKSLLPQYSRPQALKRYKQTVGREIAAEFPILDAPNADGPAEPKSFDPAEK